VVEIAKKYQAKPKEENWKSRISIIEYLKQGKLQVSILIVATAWSGYWYPPNSLQAAHFVEVIDASAKGFEIRNAFEEIAYRKMFIGKEQFASKLPNKLGKSGYGAYLRSCFKIKMG